MGDHRKSNENMLPTIVKNYIDKIIKREGFLKSKVYSQKVSDTGNYLADLYATDIKGETKNGEKEMNLFVKKFISDGDLDHLLINNLYATEAIFYNDISIIFTELQDEANIPIDERYNMVKSYEANSEVIILENFVKKGYETPDAIEVVPLKLAELSVQQLAKFHGLSFVLQKRRPEIYDNILKSLPPKITNEEALGKFSKKLINILIDNMDDEEYKKKMLSYIPTIMDEYPKYLLKNNTTVTCICHGDFKQINSFIKENNGEITEVVIIDYQWLRCSNPVQDLLYFIFLGTDREFRKNYLTHIKNLYHESLKTFLKYFDMDVESVYPKKEFEENFKDILNYGLMIVLLYYTFAFAPKNNTLEFDKEVQDDTVLKLDSRVQKRTKEVIDEFVEWGILQKD